MKLNHRLSALALLLVSCSATLLHGQTLTFGQRTYAGYNTYTHIDLNQDGREDLVYPASPATTSSPGGFDVVLSNGDGTYANPVFYAAPNGQMQNIVFLDINNDGYPDLFTWNGGSYFYEYLNNKSGGFHLQATYDIADFPQSLTVGDFNHDGYLDLAYLEPAGPTSTVLEIHVLFNNHASGFSVGPVTTLSRGGAMFVGDFDGDGKADIFLQNSAGFSTICYGDNAGHFSAQTSVNTQYQPTFFPMDLDGDGKTDLVGAGTTYDPSTRQTLALKDLFVIYGTSNRTVAQTAIPLEQYAVAGVDGGFLDQADFNGDGKADLVLVEDAASQSSSNKRLVILTGKGNRSFNAEDVVYSNSVGTLYSSAQAIRANADNKPDILTALSTGTPTSALFFLNDTSASFGGCSLPATATGIHLCSPTSYTSTKAAFSLSASGLPLMHRMELWVDGVKEYQQFARDFSHSAFLDTTLTLTKGTHKISVYAAGEDNSLQNKAYTVTVQ